MGLNLFIGPPYCVLIRAAVVRVHPPYPYPLFCPFCFTVLGSYSVSKKRGSTMASSSLTSTLNSSPFCPKFFYRLPSATLLSSTYTLKLFPTNSKSLILQKRRCNLTIKAQTLDFSGSFYEGGFGPNDDPSSPSGSGMTAVEDKEVPQCPPGLRQYETMAVLRPDMSEDERLALTQKYEEVKF